MSLTITFAVVIAALTLVVGILVKVIGFPDQFYRNYKHKSTEGLSTIFMLLTLLAYILWTIHGILQKDWVLIIGQGIGIITTALIVIQIYYYKKK